MKPRLTFPLFLTLLAIHSISVAQTDIPTINNAYNTPQVIYQNPVTTPPINNPANTLPGAPTSSSFSLPGLPSSDQSSLPGQPAYTTPSLLQELYPIPSQPTAQNQPQPLNTPSSSLLLQPVPYETIAPPTTYLPGIATIKDKQWMVSDYLYNLPPNIGIKVEVIKPGGKYIPLAAERAENRIAEIFQEAQINPPLIYECQPPLPMFYVLVMVYPCDRRCVAFVTAQLYEIAKPARIDIDLNGVWQAVTWERQTLVASSCEDFAHEVMAAIEDIVYAFTNRFNFYHPPLERPCYPSPPNTRADKLYKKYYEERTPCCPKP